MSAGCATNTAHLDPRVHMERKLNICRVSYAHFSCMVKEHAQFLWVLLRSICLLCDSRKSFFFGSAAFHLSPTPFAIGPRVHVVLGACSLVFGSVCCAPSSTCRRCYDAAESSV